MDTDAGNYLAELHSVLLVGSRSHIPNSHVPSLAHLLAAAFELLRFELPVFVIRLGEMVGVDKRVATPETAKCLFPAWELNRIVSDAVSRHNRRRRMRLTTTKLKSFDYPFHGWLVAERFSARTACSTRPQWAVLTVEYAGIASP